VTLSGRIGEHYEIVRLLGSGAMGEVYRAVDRKMFDRTVAIKFLSERLTDSEEGRLRFRREVETSARLHHPNIVTIYDWGEHLGRDYFVMEFVDGRDLQGLLRAGVTWDLEMRLEVAFQVADALEFAHRAGVIHRDIKPGNVMVVLSDSGPRVKLVDFGIAHVDRSNLTLTQSHPGTYAYMSPEQLRGEKDLDSRSDLFSLGIVYGELFSGHHPFEAASEAMISSRVLRDEPDRPSRHRADLPPDLEALILRMLAKDAGERPGSAREVADALRELLRKAVARSAGADPSFTALDDLERQLVESLVSWAKVKESEGALGDALAAYEKATRLAPESEWIKRKVPELTRRTEEQRELNAELRELERHLASDRAPQARESMRKAMALAPDDPRLAAYEARIRALEAMTPEAKEREQFVTPRMKELDAALDAGNINESMSLLSEILRKYPDQTDAAVMLERLIEVAKGDIAYGDYRAAIRDAWTRLNAGDVDAATVACERATVLWPAGPEAQTLEAAIVSARDDARRRAREAEAEKRREEAERVRRQNEVLERYLDGARNLVSDARAIAPDSPAEASRAIEAFGNAVKALDLVLADKPDHAVAAQTRREVLAEIADLKKRLAEQEAPAKRAPAKRAPAPQEPRVEPRPERAPRTRLVAAAAIVLIAIGMGAFAIWKMRPRPLSQELELVLRLSEGSEKEVADKLQRIRAIDALLPASDARKENLARQEERLLNLDEMYRDIERLEVLLRGAAGSAGEPGGSAKLVSDAENVLNLLRGFRSAIEGDDPTAILLEKKGQSIVAEIKDRIGG
jgi:serine/threonine protein kinase